VFAVGAAVVRFSVNEQGQTTDVDVAASIPERWFRESVERVMPQWRVQRAASSPANCRYAPILYQGVVFFFR
jgi:outer membrane biosynthesis protein TonB